MYPSMNFQRQASFATLYKTVGITSELSSATPHRLIAMLFEGLFDALIDARGAIRVTDIPRKCKALSKAVRILDEGLRAGLNLEAGGELAENLAQLYDYVMRRLTLANLHNDEAIVEECQRLLLPLKEAWDSIAPGSVVPDPAAR